MPPAILPSLLTYDALIAAAVTGAFAGGAWLLRGVTPGGAVAGFVVAFAIFVTAGVGGFAALVTVFLVAWLTTRLGSRRKRALGLSQDLSGRSAVQVLANLGAAGVFCMASSIRPDRGFFLLMAMAALAEAAADTAASECGEALSERAYLITSWRAVPAGTDGGISWPGMVAAMAAAGIIAVVASATGVVAWSTLPVVAAAGFLGSVIDSVLGATLERAGILGNNGVNLAGTFVAGVLALLLGTAWL
ncbi:MAG: DUF92 domain-containing protein [Terriglobales bacterium]